MPLTCALCEPSKDEALLAVSLCGICCLLAAISGGCDAGLGVRGAGSG